MNDSNTVKEIIAKPISKARYGGGLSEVGDAMEEAEQALNQLFLSKALALIGKNEHTIGKGAARAIGDHGIVRDDLRDELRQAFTQAFTEGDK